MNLLPKFEVSGLNLSRDMLIALTTNNMQNTNLWLHTTHSLGTSYIGRPQKVCVQPGENQRWPSSILLCSNKLIDHWLASRNAAPAVSNCEVGILLLKWLLVRVFVCSLCRVIVAGDKVEEDDIHLILEYKKGEKWGRYEAPRSNRLREFTFRDVNFHHFLYWSLFITEIFNLNTDLTVLKISKNATNCVL